MKERKQKFWMMSLIPHLPLPCEMNRRIIPVKEQKIVELFTELVDLSFQQSHLENSVILSLFLKSLYSKQRTAHPCIMPCIPTEAMHNILNLRHNMHNVTNRMWAVRQNWALKLLQYMILGHDGRADSRLHENLKFAQLISSIPY